MISLDAVDCQLSEWTPKDECSKTCGTGEQSWSREVVVAARNGGAQCDDHRKEIRACNTNPCPGIIQLKLISTSTLHW